MLILIDLASGDVSVVDSSEFTRFAVALRGDGDVAEVVRTSGLGQVADDGEHVAVDPEALRALAGPAVDAAWEEGFAGMCAYAASKGWVDAGGRLLAHIERAQGAAPG